MFPAERRDLNQVTWAAWLLAAVAAACWIAFGPERHPANHFYRQAAQRWAAGTDLYDRTGAGFLYLPQAALLYWPLTLLPRPVEEIVWRCAGAALLAFGLSAAGRQWSTLCGGAPFLVLSAFTLPKSLTCLLNGQATLAMTGSMLLCLAAISRRRFWQAAWWGALGLAIKPLAVVLVLLIWPLYRPLWLRLPLVLGILGAVPCVAGDVDFAVRQYAGFLGMLRSAAEQGLSTEWPQLFSLSALVGLPVAPRWQWWMRCGAALATLAAAWVARRRQSTGAAEPVLYVLSACYLLLFNPRTENNSYVMLSAALGLLWIRRGPGARWLAFVLGALGVLNVAGYEMCRALTPQAGFVWTGPLAAMLCAAQMARGAWKQGEMAGAVNEPGLPSVHASGSHFNGRHPAVTMG